MNSGNDLSGFKRSYEMHPSPPSPMAWEAYEQRVIAEWTTLLDSDSARNERGVHEFLANHPSMIPGAYSVTGPSGHGPFPGAVLSESPLSGIGVKVLDFIWLSKDSANFTPVFVEIESPCKRWFTQRGQPTHDLTQAFNQIAEWRAWLNRPENLGVFYESYEIPDYMRRHLTVRPEFVLIYGRRRESEARPELIRLREQFERHGQVVMTYDRLHPAHDCSLFLSATKRNGRYRALAVPATLELGPNSASWLTEIDGIAEAVQRNEWMSQERRQFLLDRLPYWIDWAKLPNHGIINSGDWE